MSTQMPKSQKMTDGSLPNRHHALPSGGVSQRDEALQEQFEKMSQQLIQAVNGLNKVQNARTLNGAKKASEIALRKSGFWPDQKGNK